jgi:hypothetical protein
VISADLGPEFENASFSICGSNDPASNKIDVKKGQFATARWLMSFTEAGIERDTSRVPKSDSNVTDLSGSHFVSFTTNCQIRTF